MIDTSKSFTVAGWVKFSDLSGYQAIASMDGTSVSPFYLEKTSAGQFGFGMSTTDATNTSFPSATGVTPTTGRWYHLAGVYDAAAGSISLYVDGSLQQTTTGASTFRATGATTIGRAKYAGNVDFVNGAIDDVRFYDRTLTASSIGELYALGDVAGPTGGSVDATELTGTGSRWSTSTTLSTVSDTVADGACYRYSYVVSDAQGNPTTYTSGDILVDSTSPGAPTLAFSAPTNAYASGSTLYYRSATTGSVTLTASASDATAGIASYSFPSLGSGWTSTPGATG